ncbi:MAG: P1 family peptidase, partial [Thermomicrobiales bacterium]
ILLTGTLSAFRVADALVSFMIAQPGNEAMTSVNPVVGETNDGYLSDIRSRPLTEAHVLEAIGTARGGAVEEGCVGAGTGTTALGFKAGIGTSSRAVEVGDATFTLGVLVQANFSGTLSVLGVPMPADELLAEAARPEPETPPTERGNSCMIVVATDAPVDARQLGRIARRAVFGMARVGADYTHGSGDYGIAFSVGEGAPLQHRALDPLFIAVQEAVEEALLNSLFMAETTIGYQGHTRYAIPLDALHDRLVAAGRLPE